MKITYCEKPPTHQVPRAFDDDPFNRLGRRIRFRGMIEVLVDLIGQVGRCKFLGRNRVNHVPLSFDQLLIDRELFLDIVQSLASMLEAAVVDDDSLGNLAVSKLPLAIRRCRTYWAGLTDPSSLVADGEPNCDATRCS